MCTRIDPDSALIDEALDDARRFFDDVVDVGATLLIFNYK